MALSDDRFIDLADGVMDKDQVSEVFDICKNMLNNFVYEVNKPRLFKSSTGCEIVTAEIGNSMERNSYPLAIIRGQGEIGEFEKEAKNFLLEKRFIDEMFDGEKVEEDSISDLYFEDGIKKIKANSFEGMPILYCYFPESLEEIGEHAFKSCENLLSIRLREGLKYIRKGAFEECVSLGDIIIPPTVEEISENAFLNCGAEFIIMRDKEKGSVKGAPWGAKNSTVVWKDTNGFYVSDDGELLYRVPEDVTGHIIPQGVKIIGRHAFEYNNIETIDIPDHVEEIQENAFFVSKLREVNFGKGLKIIGTSAFGGCGYLKRADIPCGVEILDGTFSWCQNLESVTIAKGVKKIYGVFEGCYSLKELIIPETVEEMDGKAFSFMGAQNCDKKDEGRIERLEVHKDNKYFVSENGIIYTKDKSRLVCASTIGGKSFVVPDSVKTIDTYAFCANRVWENIIIPYNDGIKPEYNPGYPYLFCENVIDHVEIPVSFYDNEYSIFFGCKINKLTIKGTPNGEHDMNKIASSCEIKEVVFE